MSLVSIEVDYQMAESSICPIYMYQILVFHFFYHVYWGYLTLKLMHDIVSNIEKLEDIPSAVSRKISEGEIKEHEKEIIISEIEGYLTKPEVVEWYSGIYTVLNEAVVLHPNSGISRPDRVMLGKDRVIVVDYKFGEIEETKYKYQVKRYMKSISDMGYTNVEGFIYYVKTGKVETI